MPLSDIEIANKATLKPIQEISDSLQIPDEALELYGKHKAKVDLNKLGQAGSNQENLILVTAITPTPAGEGKTTTTIGLTDGLNKIGKKAVAALREPSLGPVFGIKGGAAGGGYSQVIPMEDINLHFTGDFSAVEKANNLLAAVIDNKIQSKNPNIHIDPRTVIWKRVMDMNDRALRSIISGMGGKPGGFMRETGFNITAASEIMAILCFSKDLKDLQDRIDRIYIGDTFDGEPVFAKDLNVSGALAILLKDAIKPNLVQTLEHNPVFIHGGPFANIAQGTNTILATKAAIKLGDYAITEAGFGADLGAEKFLNLKCVAGELSPKAVVIVATIRALKYHGGQSLKELTTPNPQAVQRGVPNLEKHIETIQGFGLPVVVSINKFSSDTPEEIAEVAKACENKGVGYALSEGWEKGGDGCIDLAKRVVEAAEGNKERFTPTYDRSDSAEVKMTKIAQAVYGADGVELSAKAKRQLKRFNDIGLGNLPICMAKTQKSLSDNDNLVGRPTGFTISIREFEVASGAGFIIPIAGNMLRMPGLPGVPAAENMSIDENGVISGLS